MGQETRRRLGQWAWLLWVALGLPALSACSGDPGTGPVPVKWDRYTCERCRMVVSDPKHAAQVRVQEPGGRSRVYFFDDIGCAVIWLQDKPFRDAPQTEVWVSDWRDGHWIDARKAYYVLGQLTPMEYGLGAQSDPQPDNLSFEQAETRVLELERRFNVHGAQPMPSDPAGQP